MLRSCDITPILTIVIFPIDVIECAHQTTLNMLFSALVKRMESCFFIIILFGRSSKNEWYYVVVLISINQIF